MWSQYFFVLGCSSCPSLLLTLILLITNGLTQLHSLPHQKPRSPISSFPPPPSTYNKLLSPRELTISVPRMLFSLHFYNHLLVVSLPTLPFLYLSLNLSYSLLPK